MRGKRIPQSSPGAQLGKALLSCDAPPCGRKRWSAAGTTCPGESRAAPKAADITMAARMTTVNAAIRMRKRDRLCEAAERTVHSGSVRSASALPVSYTHLRAHETDSYLV